MFRFQNFETSISICNSRPNFNLAYLYDESVLYLILSILISLFLDFKLFLKALKCSCFKIKKHLKQKSCLSHSN
jgi:hypothetical protein